MRYFVMETPMDNMITDALMWKFNVDVVVSNGFRFCPPLHVKDGETADITMDYLYSMIPVDSQVIMADVTGQQLRDWLEKELENVFAKDPARRLGGWLVRFQGMRIRFTIEKEAGTRLEEVLVKGEKLDASKVYKVVSCEREGDPDSLLCRIRQVKNNHRLGTTMYTVMEEYFAEHSPVSPRIEGRVVATDAAPTLLTQVKGINYQFR
jgi:sulfur-oxidizing protein SoxB